jgi:hypothetical protein
VVKRKKAPAEMNRGSLFALVSARSVAGLMSMIIRNFPISVNRDFVRSAQQQAKQRACAVCRLACERRTGFAGTGQWPDIVCPGASELTGQGA